MKNVKVKIIVRDTPRTSVDVGDVVEFQVGDEIIQDTVTFIQGGLIEGERFDLSGVSFKIVKKNTSNGLF